MKTRILNAYIGTVWAIALLLILTGVHGTSYSSTPSPGILGFWLLFSLAAECLWLETPSRGGMVSMSMAVNIASLFVLPARVALALAALSVGLADQILHHRSLTRALFNGAQTAIALGACVAILRLGGLGETVTGTELLLRSPGAVLALAPTFFVINTGLVAGAIALSGGLSLWRAWRQNYGVGYQYLSSAALFFLGLSLVVSYEQLGMAGGFLYLVVFFFVRDSYERYVRELRARRRGESSRRAA